MPLSKIIKGHFEFLLFSFSVSTVPGKQDVQYIFEKGINRSSMRSGNSYYIVQNHQHLDMGLVIQKELVNTFHVKSCTLSLCSVSQIAFILSLE